MIFRKKENIPDDRKGSAPIEQRPGALMWRRFRRNRLSMWSLRVLYVLLFLAIFGDFIANDKPIYCNIDGQTYFPIFRQYAVDLGWMDQKAIFFQKEWDEQQYESVVFPPIPYSATTIDLANRSRSPFSEQKVSRTRYRHWLGTDQLGHDLTAGLIAGTRIALLVGLIAMSIATVIGLFFGSLAGFFGDRGYKVTRLRLWGNVLALPVAWFYGFHVRRYALVEGGGSTLEIMTSLAIFATILLVINLFIRMLEKWPPFEKKISLPLDLLVMRGIEVMNSIPALLLLLSLIAVIESNSIFSVMAIIGLIRWTGIARFLRAELLKIRQLNYIEAGRALGFSNGRLLLRHALPNAITPVLITIAFGIAGAILLESALSFLGIGIGEDGITWGRLLSEARNQPSAWWLAVLPGGAIFVTVTVFNLIGDGLSKAMGAR